MHGIQDKRKLLVYGKLGEVQIPTSPTAKPKHEWNKRDGSRREPPVGSETSLRGYHSLNPAIESPKRSPECVRGEISKVNTTSLQQSETKEMRKEIEEVSQQNVLVSVRGGVDEGKSNSCEVDMLVPVSTGPQVTTRVPREKAPDLTPPKWAVQTLQAWIGDHVFYEDGLVKSNYYYITTCESSKEAEKTMEEIKETDRYAALMPKAAAEEWARTDHLVVHLEYPFYLQQQGKPTGSTKRYSWLIKGCGHKNRVVFAVAPNLYSNENNKLVMMVKHGVEIPTTKTRAARVLAAGVCSIREKLQIQSVKTGIATTKELRVLCEDVKQTHHCNDFKALGKHTRTCLAGNCSIPCDGRACLQRYYAACVQLVQTSLHDNVLREGLSRAGEFMERLSTGQAQILIKLSLSRLASRRALEVKDRVVNAAVELWKKTIEAKGDEIHTAFVEFFEDNQGRHTLVQELVAKFVYPLVSTRPAPQWHVVLQKAGLDSPRW